MRGKIVLAGLVFGLCGFIVSAQDKTPDLFPNDIYCSGIVTTEAVPRDTHIVSGEGSQEKFAFSDHDYVYVSRGSSQGVKVGDMFSVVRPVEDPTKVEWTRWQAAIIRKMGTVWEDEGRVTIVEVRPDLSIAQITKSCGYLQRADILLPLIQRPEPPLKPVAQLERFTPVNGKTKAMVVTGQKFQAQMGKNDIVYVNLGNGQGVKVGDYFRVFRYTGTQHETAYQTKRFAFDVDGDLGPTYGYGAVANKWDWNNTPREVIGEGVVLRTAPNAATVLITFTAREIYAGDYVELE